MASVPFRLLPPLQSSRQAPPDQYLETYLPCIEPVILISGGGRMNVVSEHDWLSALSSLDTTIEIPVRGFSRTGPDWGWAHRDWPRHIVWLLSGGHCRGTVCGDPVTLKAGDFFWFSPHAAHAFGIDPGREHARIHFVNLVVRDSRGPLRLADNYVRLENMMDLAADMAALVDEVAAPRPWHEMRIRSMLVLLFSNVFARRRAAEIDRHVLDRRQRERLMAFVDNNIAARPSAAHLAELLDLSPDYFTRLFRRTFGKPPRTWLVEERIRRAAAALLEYPLPVHRIGRMFGYDDQFLFTRQFTKVMGASPRAWRAGMTRRA